MPLLRTARPPKDQQRVTFRTPDGEVVTSLWCLVVPAVAGVTVTLLHDYGTDFQPAAGWLMEAGETPYAVTKADGRVIEGVTR